MFLGICRTPEITCPTYLEKRGTYSGWRSTSPRRIPTSSPAKALRSPGWLEGTTAKGALSLFRQPRNVMRYVEF